MIFKSDVLVIQQKAKDIQDFITKQKNHNCDCTKNNICNHCNADTSIHNVLLYIEDILAFDNLED